ncbi:MAG TPA: hypothetical protein VEC37_12245 [Bacillota bacterium]|nr:hypothetical protein [Bacillota bacterium]
MNRIGGVFPLVTLTLIVALIPPDILAATDSDTLNAGAELLRGQGLRSNNGHYLLDLRNDGNLVLSENSGKMLWNSKTHGKAVRACIMQPGGNLVLAGIDHQVLWSSNTGGNNHARLVLQNDGRLVIIKRITVWSSNTVQAGMPKGASPNRSVLTANQELLRGQSLISSNNRFQLTLQNEGNLVVCFVVTGQVLWNSVTKGQDVQGCLLQADGNLVLYNHGKHVVWHTNTWGYTNPILMMQDDGNAVINADTVIWAVPEVRPGQR